MKADIITHDVISAYESKSEEKVKVALNSVKLLLDETGDVDIEIAQLLNKNGLKLIWNKVSSGNEYIQKLGVRYKDMAFEI